MRTVLWSYLGWPRFPRELSLFEVRRFFSLSLPDRHVLRRRFRSRARLGAPLQLGFVRMTGTLRRLGRNFSTGNAASTGCALLHAVAVN
jgi:hypothetical protein